MLSKMYFSKAYFFATLLCLPMLAHAETGGYIGIIGGLNHEYSQRLKQNGDAFVNMKFKNDLQDAYVYGLTAGWKDISGFRPELEISMSTNELDKFSDRVYDGNGTIPAKGREKSTNYFANVWYDFPGVTNSYNMHPYLGVGAGLSHVRGEDIQTQDGNFGSLTDNVFGYQVGAGLRFPIVSNLITSFDIRYLKTQKIDFGDIPGLPPGHVTTKSSSTVFQLGLSYFF
ncbi:outer membrane protein [Aquirhabdus sp.]|uniref:outer membrane protein n=1 Tax=Aquirhabdus sp. TaxID=2824160 RepID=UPI00396CF7EE